MKQILLTATLVITTQTATAAPSQVETKLRSEFSRLVQPFLQRHCSACHGKQKQASMLDLRRVANFNRANAEAAIWKHVREKLHDKSMPPDDAPRQPTAAGRKQIVQWIDRMLKYHADRNAGDPGLVLARRLSAAEYNYTIRDLTGVDIQPAKQFPIDPTNEAGFDNSGESLSMTPALLRKYLSAARLVADHLVLKPKGFVFASHPMVTDSERDKYCVTRIIRFYKRHAVDYADYLQAAWLYKHRADPDTKLSAIAGQRGVSGKYLLTIWRTFEVKKHRAGPLKSLQQAWLALPNKLPAAELRKRCVALRDKILAARKKLTVPVGQVTVKGLQRGSQSVVLWKNRQMAERRQRYVGDGSQARKKVLSNFCRVFPDTFVVTERGRVFLDPKKQNRGRLLSAGFHLMVGYFRDDAPLYYMVLNKKQQQELDQLWRELNFITRTPIRQYKDFVYYERAESPRILQDPKFDFARPEDKDIASPQKLQRLRDLYLAVLKSKKPTKEGYRAVEKYFLDIETAIRIVRKERLAAQKTHLTALFAFAARAYRRPLRAEEAKKLFLFYESMRKDGLSHEDALRDCVTSVLMSPYFCYRTLGSAGPSTTKRKPGEPFASQPLSATELASRLSYFLWSSQPDRVLVQAAKSGQLTKPNVLLAQAKRMLKDTRSRGLAVEFGGHWLGFRRFEQHNSVDRKRFPTFNDQLRKSMYEEPVRLFLHILQQDRSVLDFLYGKYTFVDATLAKHYGAKVRSAKWQKLPGADKIGRGGLLPMSVFLTKNSPGLRTSPVKRGYWVVRQLLGERIPPPPAKVPELPEDEAKLGKQTLRQVLAQHRSIKSCAQCHTRFDSVGLAFEGYGPVGERRKRDLGGRKVDTRADFPGGSSGQGLRGLQNYVQRYRQHEFVDNLCRKLLAYSLGRTLLLSDEPLIAKMKRKLKAEKYRFQSLIETILLSRQFLHQRK